MEAGLSGSLRPEKQKMAVPKNEPGQLGAGQSTRQGGTGQSSKRGGALARSHSGAVAPQQPRGETGRASSAGRSGRASSAGRSPQRRGPETSSLASASARPAAPAGLQHGSSGVFGLDGGTWRRLQSLQGMHSLYRAADRNIGALSPAAAIAARAPARRMQQLGLFMAQLSRNIDNARLSREDAYLRVLDAQPLRCTVNAWVREREALARLGQSTTAFDVLWYCLARAQFDARLHYGSQAGRWGRALAEMLLIEYLFVRPDDTAKLAACDALIRAEVSALSLRGSDASPEHIDQLLQLCPHLRTLDLRGSRATERNVATLLRSCARLEHIRLTDTRLGGQAVEALVEALPMLVVEI